MNSDMGPVVATAIAGGIAGVVAIGGLRVGRGRDTYLRGVLIAVAAIVAFEATLWAIRHV